MDKKNSTFYAKTELFSCGCKLVCSLSRSSLSRGSLSRSSFSSSLGRSLSRSYLRSSLALLASALLACSLLVSVTSATYHCNSSSKNND